MQFFIAKTDIHGFTVWCENCILQPALFVVKFLPVFYYYLFTYLIITGGHLIKTACETGHQR